MEFESQVVPLTDDGSIFRRTLKKVVLRSHGGSCVRAK